ncbi:glycosyltransferase family 2 protein [Lutibacter maritimus]|uniref:Glycosyltransferase involved in cell wall bisynthesis n=1 Tax=Lutibacter maritimus TaxID=593133 RepID=A0A1I6SNT8_9FLAO|nr:glycosyltransferase family A protein [Lutibacter maritimus]SFS78619.1 Glycosyltransferase involved in cell wall bisynthesis [Lutibacter maritimus]
MNTPLVSIIIPTYNRAHLIGETLDSVLAQTYTHWECIVVDDGSTDGTEEVLKMFVDKDDRIQYHLRPKDRPKGANACRNYGFELSKGEYINWFDDDDVMLPDFIKLKKDAFTSSIDLVICSGFLVDSDLEHKNAIILNEKPDLYKEYVLWRLRIITGCVLFKRSFLKNKELYCHIIKRGQESELFSRLFFKLPENSFKIINEPLFLYRQHVNTKSTKNLAYVKEYKESETIIAFENLKKSIVINDCELTNYLYKFLINIFFRGIENNHLSNSKKILSNLLSVVHKKNFQLALKLFIFCNFFLFINRGSYRIEKNIKKYKF